MKKAVPAIFWNRFAFLNGAEGRIFQIINDNNFIFALVSSCRKTTIHAPGGQLMPENDKSL
jgi:hypothetical protein